MKRIFTLLFCLAASVGIVYLTKNNKISAVQVTEGTLIDSIIPQKIEEIGKEPHEVYEIYNAQTLIGVLNDYNKLREMLDRVYAEQYESEYADSSLELTKNIVIAEEQTYFQYENVDDVILNYIRDEQLFSLKTVAVDFSDANGVYDEIFVASEEIYTSALNKYLSFFVNEEDYALIRSGSEVPELKTYGSKTRSMSISQTISIRKDALADPAEIMKTEEEVLHYLEYGKDTELEYYTIKKYDTVAGVGAQNHGLSATQIMNINRDKISSVDQVLEEGEVLCITYFNSPIDVVTNVESMKKETIYPETIYQEDETVREGVTELKQSGVNGERNALYSEKWINGVLVSGTLKSSVDTLQPIDEVILVGTLSIPGVGTGTYRWPVDNHIISCRWGCYSGHRAIDIQNQYNLYGALYAADRGVIEINSYNSINGNYVVINHNNGYHTYYGHLNVPSPLPVGTVVDKGDVIGQLGMTGKATGPHVHFFIMNDDGGRYDPCDGFLPCG